MTTSRVLRNLVMVLREKKGVMENTQRQLRQKEKECDELKDQCLAFKNTCSSHCNLSSHASLIALLLWQSKGISASSK